MRHLVWLDSALNDIVRLKYFLAEANHDAAKRAAGSLIEAATRLLDYPLVGKPIEELPEYRDLLTRFGAGRYILRYRIYEDTSYVVHVRHYHEEKFKA